MEVNDYRSSLTDMAHAISVYALRIEHTPLFTKVTLKLADKQVSGREDSPKMERDNLN